MNADSSSRVVAAGALCALLGIGLAPLVAAEAASKPGTVEAFAKLRSLSGTWKGKSSAGEPITIVFKVAAAGTTVIETQAPGDEDEMVTVYSVSGGDLILTHYCPMGEHGNAPHLVLDREASSAEEYRFRFTGGENLGGNDIPAVHAGRLLFNGENHIVREWDVYKGAFKVSTLRFVLERAN